jgi:hypothetical protein
VRTAVDRQTAGRIFKNFPLSTQLPCGRLLTVSQQGDGQHRERIRDPEAEPARLPTQSDTEMLFDRRDRHSPINYSTYHPGRLTLLRSLFFSSLLAPHVCHSTIALNHTPSKLGLELSKRLAICSPHCWLHRPSLGHKRSESEEGRILM